MEIKDIKKFVVLGAGTLGLRVGLQAAISGFNTVIYDIKEEAFEAARRNHEGILKMLIRHERLTQIYFNQLASNNATACTSLSTIASRNRPYYGCQYF